MENATSLEPTGDHLHCCIPVVLSNLALFPSSVGRYPMNSWANQDRVDCPKTTWQSCSALSRE
eukprot:2411427-Amphidinium_carterae.1